MSHIDDLATAADSWVRENWDPSITLATWWERLAAAGYAAPELPPAAGGLGLGPESVQAIGRALAQHGCIGPPGGIGMMLAAPTIAAHGTVEQISTFLPPILDGRHAWCQLFSEPNAGSDLASLQCRAVRDGDEWVITGQKVWTSGGQLADFGMLLARTDPAAAKRRGITWFAFPMRQPGVAVRPLREMTGEAVFNEVFIDGARVPDSGRIGDVNDGWRVAATTLGVERARLGSAKIDLPSESPGELAGRLGLAVGALVAATPKGEDFLAGTHLGVDDARRWVALAAALGRLDDPIVRDALARLYSLTRISWWAAQRANAGCVDGAGNIAKLMMAELFRRFRDVGNTIIGADGMLDASGARTGGEVQRLTLFSPAPAIYGGTDQIQRNILAERVLGLPRDPT